MGLPPIDPGSLTAAQQEVYDTIASGPRGGTRGPFSVLLHSPGLTRQVEKVGAYLRYESLLPARARELAILTVAQKWRSDVEWVSHMPHALKAGLSPDELSELGLGRAPAFKDESDRVTYRFVREVIEGRTLPDAILEEALALFGRDGVVDLAAVVGYYIFLSVVLISFDVSSEGGKPPWR